jgi:hypothetical protein
MTSKLLASGSLALWVVMQLGTGRYVFADSVQLATTAGSHATPPAGGGGDSGAAIVTPDGRFVVFASQAKNLLSPATNPRGPESSQAPLDVFLRDRTNGTYRPGQCRCVDTEGRKWRFAAASNLDQRPIRSFRELGKQPR